MKSPQKYSSATAFRTALEDRLKKMAQLENIDLQRLRRQAVFDRLLFPLHFQYSKSLNKKSTKLLTAPFSVFYRKFISSYLAFGCCSYLTIAT